MIRVEGARVHNLKNIDVSIPRGSLTVITGLSGSGKSSLAFDTIYAEGQRRYIETFSAYARNFLGNRERPDVDLISGLSPVISIEQKTTNRSPRSTVGTTTEISDFLRLLFARAADAFSYVTGEAMVRHTEEEILSIIRQSYEGRRVMLMAPIVKARKGHYREVFEQIIKGGYLWARVDGELREVMPGMQLDRYKVHTIEVVIDRLRVSNEDDGRLLRSLRTALKQGQGLVCVLDMATNDVRHLSKTLMCPTSGIAYRDPAPHNFSFNSPQGACPTCRGLGYIGADDDDDESGEQGEQCPECHGMRLNREALSYRIDGRNIAELSSMDLEALGLWLSDVESRMSDRQRRIAPEILKEIRSRLQFLLDVGLGYLSLSRPSASLSGGESQRIRLATQIGSQLVNVLYILDEPSIGLHQRDNRKLIASLKALRDIGNTVIVVEHDEEMMQSADHIIDIGPLAGRRGGEVVYEGSYADMLKADTLTSAYLSRRLRLPVPEQRRSGTGQCLTLRGCRGNNLKGIDVSFPLGTLVAVTGVSGSGKSTLVNQTLHPLLSQRIYRSKQAPLAHDAAEGVELVDKVVSVDQTPLGRTPRSCPATYTGLMDDIRALFVQLPEAKIRGYKPGRFSFNVKGGRCEACGGNGYRTIEMSFLPDVYAPCHECRGRRYNRETLEVRFKGKSIGEVLDMTINQAVDFFAHQPHICHKLSVMQDVGLGYLRLGQPCTTISGGESQRVKLASELAKRDTGHTVYILDEPTTGLHFHDIGQLLVVLNRLVDKGNTVVVIEHNLDVVRAADHIIEIGPNGGQDGGLLVFAGTPEELRRHPEAPTSQYI